MTKLFAWDTQGDAEGWVGGTGVSVQQYTMVSRTGPGCLLVSKISDVAGTIVALAHSGSKPANIGEPYELRAWVSIDSSTAPHNYMEGRLRVMYNGTHSWGHDSMSRVVVSPAGWTELVMDTTAVDWPNVHRVEVEVSAYGASAGPLIFRVDDFESAEGTPPAQAAPPSNIQVSSAGVVTFDAAVAPAGEVVTGYLVRAEPVTQTAPIGDGSDPVGPEGTFALAWADEFEGSSIDTNKWQFGESGMPSTYDKHDATVFRNPTNAHIEVSNSVAKIKARRTSFAESRGEKMETTVITSHGKEMDWFTHGVIEARVRTPTAKSLWPAIWLMGNGMSDSPPQWPGTGEIDILEFFNNEAISGAHITAIHCTHNGDDWEHPDFGGGTGKRVHATQHSNVPPGEPGYDSYTVRPYWEPNNWHTYSFHRTSNFMKTYVDGNLIYTWEPGDAPAAHTPDFPVPQYIFDTPMHVRFDLQVGGEARYEDPAGEPYPRSDGSTDYVIWEEGDYEIDYVRVWEPA